MCTVGGPEALTYAHIGALMCALEAQRRLLVRTLVHTVVHAGVHTVVHAVVHTVAHAVVHTVMPAVVHVVESPEALGWCTQ